jgi:hypothetical protein
MCTSSRRPSSARRSRPDEFDPDLDNALSEWARAVVVDSAGNALVVGEREYKDGDFMNIYSRAFAVQVHPFGQVLGTPWTSWAPAFLHDACGRSQSCGDDYVAGGWTRDRSTRTRSPSRFSSGSRPRHIAICRSSARRRSTASHATARENRQRRDPVIGLP